MHDALELNKPVGRHTPTPGVQEHKSTLVTAVHKHSSKHCDMKQGECEMTLYHHVRSIVPPCGFVASGAWPAVVKRVSPR